MGGGGPAAVPARKRASIPRMQLHTCGGMATKPTKYTNVAASTCLAT